jgi:peptide/nickel transport system substrate-binding protein
MDFRRSILAMAALAVVTASAGIARGGGTAADPRPRTGGTVSVSYWEPTHLNPFIDSGDHPSAYVPRAITLAGAFRVTPRFTYERDLVVKASVRPTAGGMRIRYVIDKRARWNDGVPITAEDFRFTWRALVSGALPTPYGAVTNVTGGRRRTVTVKLRRVVASWRALFEEVLPAHALAGVPLETVWRSAIDNPRTGKPIASGPFYLAEWRKGCCMIFKRNTRYWKRRPHLDGIVLRFEDEFQAYRDLLRGRLDILPGLFENACAYEDLCGRNGIAPPPRLRAQVRPGPLWETLFFNVGYGKGPQNPLLRKTFVRRAIAYAVDRVRMASVLLVGGPLRTFDSVIIVRASPYYRPFWAKYRYSVREVRAIMERNGCRRGADGIYVCAGRRASFTWMGTSGGTRRELNFELARPRLAAAGIEVRGEFPPPSVAFGRRLPEGDYDIANYSLPSMPDLSGWDGEFGCGGASNRQGYCDRKVTAWLRAANREPSATRQAALTNRALARMAAAVPVLPLYQLPTLLIRDRRVHGVVDTGLEVGPLWNVEDWWRARS